MTGPKGGYIDHGFPPETSSVKFILDDPFLRSMRETPEEVGERDFDLWKLDRDAQEETHQAEFALK